MRHLHTNYNGCGS